MNFDKDCTTKLATILINLYAEYVEGEIESSKIEYNKLINKISVKDALYLIYHTPFEGQAIQISKSFPKGYKFPKEVINKLNAAKDYLKQIR